jgi:trehalose/maltose hydrolase-like predicted phosphorylase
LMLGPERVARSQLVKQADVLMLHHLIPDEVVPGSLARCLDFYEPRTVHGSSLSPAIHASLLARAGEPDQALALLRLAARIDLDDLSGTTSGGLHLAAMGGLWQALAWGFLGLRARGGVLWIDPRLPAAWNALALRFRVFGNPVTVRAEPGGVTVACAVPMRVRIADRAPVRCEPPGATFTVRPAEARRDS